MNGYIIPGIQERVEKGRERLGDVFLTILSSKTFEEMKSPDGKREFKEELKENFTSELNLVEGDIRRIYFGDFIIQ